MKKLLLSMVAVAASTMVANADKVAFVAADNTYTGDATQVVVLPSGFDTNDLPLTSDAVMFSGFTKSAYVTSATFRWNANTTGKITPAPGITINNIVFHAQASNKDYTGTSTLFTKDATALTQTYNGEPIKEATDITFTAQIRATMIEIEYTGTPVKMPTISADYDYVLPADKKVTISAEAGAKIYYTTDGTEPTEASTLYTEPFALEKTSYVRAIAVTDAGTSFAASKGYVSVPAGVQIATYNFTDVNSLTAPDHDVTPSSSEWALVDDTNYKITPATLTTDKTKITGDKASGSTAPCLYLSNTFGGLTQWRVYAKNELKYEVTDENYYLAGVVIVGGVNNDLGLPDTSDTTNGIGYSDDYGTYTNTTDIYQGSTSETTIWLSKEGVKNSSVTLRGKNKLSGTQFLQQFYILYAPKDASGIEGVAADNSNAPVEFYNLQGVRVANPTAGIYVKRQGNSATKVLVK
jgi:hypothetical protein